MLTQEDALRIFHEAGALKRGHFKLTSGRHSAEYWEKFWVLQWPHHVQALCGEIARRHMGSGAQVVLGPTTGGVILAFEVARQLGIRALYAEKEGGRRVLRRGFALGPGERVLVVDDVTTTLGSLKECIDLVSEHGGVVSGVAVLVDRSGGAALDMPLDALIRVAAESYDAADCPLCRDGLAITEPGSRSL